MASEHCTDDRYVDTLPGIGAALGAGGGLVLGVTIGGMAGIAVGLVIGAAAGVVLGGIARTNALHRRGG